jgi:hypothetical protein
MSGRVHLGILAVTVVVAVSLRSDLDAEGFWADELSALATSAGRPRLEWVPPVGVVVQSPASLTSLEGAPHWWSIWLALSEENHPPLYFMLLRLWQDAFGMSETSARCLSVVAATAALLLLYDTMRCLHGPAPALWGCLLMALSAPQIRYSLEARSYMLLLALALGACSALARIERSGPSRRRLLALGACLLAGAFTHYHALAALLAVALYAVVRLRGEARRSVLFVLSSVALLFASAWGPFLWVQSGQTEMTVIQDVGSVRSGMPSGGWLRAPAAGHVTRTLARAAAIPLLHLIEPMPRASQSPCWPILGYLAACALVRWRSELLLWCIWFGVSVGMLTVADLVFSLGQLEWIRYTLIASPAVFALLGASTANAPRLVRHGLPALAAMACAIAAPGAYRPAKQPWREIGAALGLAARPGEVLILDGRSASVLWPCRGMLHYAYSPSRPMLLAGDTLAPSARRRLEAEGVAWLLAPPAFDLKRRLPGAVVEESLTWPGGPPLRRLSFAAGPFGPVTERWGSASRNSSQPGGVPSDKR